MTVGSAKNRVIFKKFETISEDLRHFALYLLAKMPFMPNSR